MLLILMVLFGQTISSFAQTFRGGINGSVTDNSGAVIPGAIVTVLEVDTGQVKTAPSSSSANFSFRTSTSVSIPSPSPRPASAL